jgi:hypothetical protein
MLRGARQQVGAQCSDGTSVMIGTFSAQLGLMAFAIAIGAGLWAGNAPATVLARALAAMLMAWLVGQAIATSARHVLREHLTRRKVELDRAHLEAIEALAQDRGASEGAA